MRVIKRTNVFGITALKYAAFLRKLKDFLTCSSYE